MKIIKNKILENKNIINLKYQKLISLFDNSKTQKKNNKLLSLLHSFSGKIIFSLTKQKSSKNILKFLIQNKIYPQYLKTIIEINKNFDYFYTTESFSNNCLDKKNNILFIYRKDLLPIIDQNQSTDYFFKNNDNIKNTDLSKLIINYPIVHIEHGVGRYQGLTTIKTANIKSEYLIILYAEGDKLYVPVTYLHLISPYSGMSIENAPLHKLGNDEWNKEKQKIKKTVYDHAAQLLNIYAKRASKKGFAFKIDKEKYQLFCKDCLFTTTLDQNYVMQSILEDMSKSVPMDRLICGDVGFGKTEIAMRASFLCISNHKQVAILVPTTLLAQQHYKNFKERFSNWPVSIEILSRFKTEKEQNVIFNNIENGLINILIGTHKLLLKNVNWNSLGLLVIDEEHRFGVYHKEIIKKIYSNIDVLTLTATPIPRTLNMVMNGIKDLSIIEKPPARRLAIKTFIKEYDSLLIRKTILREISRGGQTYYIYNKVENIDHVAKKLSMLIPEANIKIGHGKMHNIVLKKVMNEFYKNKFNVLICTTIIESGVDVPKANTIIIDNADHFGLSQLHQLRGRIGRSNCQAYALFLVKNFNKITSDAKKRLEAIASVDNFGGGFSLSNQDLEIRGTGELLGKEQSGHIKNIGFALYIKLLHNAINLLKNSKNVYDNIFSQQSLKIELYVSSLLPENYIVDVNKRLFFYERISNAKNEEKIDLIKCEIINKFGQLPDFSKNLFIIAKIRLIAYEIGIKYIKSNKIIGVIKFNANNSINIQYLIKIFKDEPNIWKMENATKIKFFINFKNDFLRLTWILNFLKNLKKNNY